MALMNREFDHTGAIRSPGGFEFGLQGWQPPQQAIYGITFFLDGTVMVTDQSGQPVRGAQGADGRAVYFAMRPPQSDDKKPGYRDGTDGNGRRAYVKLATHVEAIAALEEERVDWKKLSAAGWPQLPYDQLKALKELPQTPLDELRKITDPALRKDALRIRHEVDEVRQKEMQAAAEDE